MKKSARLSSHLSGVWPFIDRNGIFVICGLFLIVGSFAFNQMIIYTPDSARYVVWANSLAQLEGFKDATGPEIVRYVVHAPLYPLLLAPSALLFPDSVIAAKATTLCIGCLAIILLFLWLKRSVGERYALAGALVLALNPLMMIYSTQILSDVAFGACVIGFFLLGRKFAEERRVPWSVDTAFVAIVVAGVFMREVGLALMLAAMAFFLWKKQTSRALIVLAVTVLFYLLWYVRNEIIVAGAENPSMRNSLYFFSHLYTPNQAGLFEEFAKRFWVNLNVYKNFLGKLLLMPEFVSRAYSVITTTDPFVAFVLRILPVGQFVLVGATFGFLGIGTWHEYKHSRWFSLIVSFLVCYSVPILFYPINDNRFLFPIVIVMIFLCIVGLRQSVTWLRSRRRSNVVVRNAGWFLILLLLPNISWMQSFAWNNEQYSRSPEDLYRKYESGNGYAEMFAKPFHLAAQWIVQHSDSSAVILTRWKELALWLDGRKIVEFNPFSTPGPFDFLLRDYAVKYIVAANWRAALNEYETLFAQSTRFDFVLRYRVGNAEVYEVVPKGTASAQDVETPDDSSTSALYVKALHSLEDNPRGAAKILKDLAPKTGGHGAIVFHIGVAEEFAGQLDSASALFAKFTSLSQAGAYIQMAWYHQEIISRIKMAEAAPNPDERARRFHVVAINYWELSYCRQAMKMLDRSLEAVPDFFPSLITYALFSYQEGDIASSRAYLKKAAAMEPSNSLVVGLSTILACEDSIRKNASQDRRRNLELEIARANIGMGIRESAIDELLSVLHDDPANRMALRLLAETYEVKRRYAPAVQMYRRLAKLEPTDSVAEAKLQELSPCCE
jgi:tetratricopeptide (TPR) repeat protein/4-amino-4-deoxy-L-arabinose transferase-like glycosyltransferase